MSRASGPLHALLLDGRLVFYRHKTWGGKRIKIAVFEFLLK
jgi:hypothetical protein